jgi:hypothetical protein
MSFYRFLEKHNIPITFTFGLISISLSLLTGDSNIFLIKSIGVVLFLIILWQLIHVEKLNNRISFLNKTITKFNNTADNMTFEILNRFRNSRESNLGLNFEELRQTVVIKGYDAKVESEFQGQCIDPKGEDSYYCELYGDSNIKFSDLNYRYFDLKHNPKDVTGLKATHVSESNKLFYIKNRFIKKIEIGHSFHIKYTNDFPNCITYGDDYYITHTPTCSNNLKKFQFRLIFEMERPECVDVFDGTHGGESKFVGQLHTTNTVAPFVYEHILENIVGARDFIYKFRRLI